MHPAYLLGPEELAMLEIWGAWRGGGMGAGHLPFAGGAADQPACVMAALAIMDDALARLRPKRSGKGD